MNRINKDLSGFENLIGQDKIIIREISTEELTILDDMLYEAVYLPEGAKPYPKDIIKSPEIYVYIDGFGNQKDDYCLIADLNGQIIGAVWVRILADKIKGFGNIDDQTPEFAISLLKEFRNRGIGTSLMQQMIEYLKKQKYIQASLSVQKVNYTVKMYQKLGFEIISENKDDYLMVLKLK